MMNKPIVRITKACLLGGALLACVPFAMARDRVDWSVSIGSPGYPPPAIYSPPPVVYAPPPVVYQPVVPAPYGGARFVYVDPYRGHGWHRHHHHGYRH
jgi:hypothetical protein